MLESASYAIVVRDRNDDEQALREEMKEMKGIIDGYLYCTNSDYKPHCIQYAYYKIGPLAFYNFTCRRIDCSKITKIFEQRWNRDEQGCHILWQIFSTVDDFY